MRSRVKTIAVIIGVLALLIGVAYSLQILRISGHVAMPPPNASAIQVVKTYVKALNEHDCDTAAALWVPSERSEGSRWCSDVEHVSATNLKQESVPFGPQITTVSAFLSVDQRLFFGDDSLPSNPFGWSFTLSHRPEGWRIGGEGQG